MVGQTLTPWFHPLVTASYMQHLRCEMVGMDGGACYFVKSVGISWDHSVLLEFRGCLFFIENKLRLPLAKREYSQRWE